MGSSNPNVQPMRHSAHLQWVRLRADLSYREQDMPEGELLSFGADHDSIPGPELGDGLSGFIRYQDTRGAEYLTQCFIWYPFTNEYQYQWVESSDVLHRELAPGEWVRTTVGWMGRALFDQGRFGDTYVDGYTRVDFGNLASVEYLWPVMRTHVAERVGEFPAATCRDLGLGDDFKTSANEVFGGVLDQTRGYQDWIPQRFEFQLPEPFNSQLFGLSETWRAANEGR